MRGKSVVSLFVSGGVSALLAFGFGFLFVGPNLMPKSGRTVIGPEAPSSVEAAATSDVPIGPVVTITPCPSEPPARTPLRPPVREAGRAEEVEAVVETKADSTSASVSAPPPGLYRVRAEEFDSQEDARRLQARLTAEGHDCALVTIYRDGAALYSVQVGAFSQPENARNTADKIRQRGYDVQIDEPD